VNKAAAARHHAEWLSLIETSGPFLTVPALVRALPDGLEAPQPAGPLRIALAEVRDDPGLQRRWIAWVLDEVLGLQGRVAAATDNDPSHRVAEHGVTLRPDFILRDSGEPVLLIQVVDRNTPLHRAPAGTTYKASPVDRAAELARGTGVPLVVVTDGEVWTLVWARVGKAVGTCTWRTDLWLEEPLTLRAFTTLLGARRFFALPVEEGLARLLEESADRQQEVADQLGTQVRHAVELLIATLDAQDRDRHGTLLGDLDSATVYRGAVTAMMRLVFLFVAEERRLLPLDDERYQESLAASTLRAQLQERADRHGPDVLDRSTAAWHRVLALFRAVHGGVEHDALRLPAYGGGLFDPDRFPFLEGRGRDTCWHDVAARPLPVDDRTMLRLLDALQTLEQGGTRVLLSYRALDVEQIGHVYEGLLDHTAVRLSGAALALQGKLEPELGLAEIEGWGDETVPRLAKATGRSERAIEKALSTEPDDQRVARLRAACENDESLLARVIPYQALLRDDLRDDPLVLVPDSLFVTQALDRRASGTYYTPRTLAEEVVQHALDPVAFSPGPAQEPDPEKWVLKSAGELLELDVCDMAMGSGAFLVAACRYLAAKLQAAWDELDPTEEWTATGRPPAEAPDEPAVPLEADRREVLALRLVAERCLYGVDKNPMAVEMAKLSLWLLTLAADQPFSFLDHALRAGDSLLGVTDERQLRAMHLDGDMRRAPRLGVDLDSVLAKIEVATAKRGELEAFVVNDAVDAERKAELLAEADAEVDDVRLLGDLVVAAALSDQDDANAFADTNLALSVKEWLAGDSAARTEVAATAADWLVETRRAVGEVQELTWDERDPFHWAVEFPEVWARRGFDAIVGNPPFQGGQKITGALGSAYRDFLVTWLAAGRRGSADLVAYFYLRAPMLLREGGSFGLIATNTVAQGDTRQVGLDDLAERLSLYRAISSEPWPGGANLEMATVWAQKNGWTGRRVLDRVDVSGFTPALQVASRASGKPARLAASRGRSFQGSNVLGLGFVLSPGEARALLDADPRNVEVIRPYLVGEDLNSRPDGSPSRWVIDFRDWPVDRAAEFHAPFARVEHLVKPERLAKRYTANKPWWQFERRRGELYRVIAPLKRCAAISLVSKAVQPMISPADIVFAHRVAVFAFEDDASFGLVSSGVHWWWAVTYSSTLETRVNYSPTDCFETFAPPELTDEVGRLGEQLHAHRSALMLDRQEGLTKTYNRVHDPDERADDITRLREIHVELDYAVRDAYRWNFDLGHEFHETKFGTRFTFAPGPRQEVLDCLLELNQARYAEEMAQGLHDKKPKRKSKARPSSMSFDV
jgi:hypothetical protein